MEGIATRVAAVRELDAKHRSVAPPLPKSVKVELTARCDLRCFFCAGQIRPRAKGEMPRALFERIAQELRRLGTEQLGLFYYGESFLCDWLPEAIRFAKQACGFPYVFLTTNGYAATAERVRECICAGLDSLKFSLNFCSPRQFEEVTGGRPRGYRTVLDNIKDARWVRDYVELVTGHRCGLYASSLLYDEAQRERMRATVDQIVPYVDEHYWLPLVGHGGLPSSGACTPPSRKPLPCWALFKEGHITWEGRVSACPLDPGARFHMGDLREQSFASAWHAPRFRELRAAHLAGEVRGTVCEHCIAYGESRPRQADPEARSRTPASAG